jgi:WD40 repeat protein
VLDVATGEILASLRGHDDRVTAVGFAQDGKRLFTAAQDRTVRVWDGADLLLTLRGHSDWITGLAVEPSGACLASASQDGTVHLWRAGPEGELP